FRRRSPLVAVDSDTEHEDFNGDLHRDMGSNVQQIEGVTPSRNHETEGAGSESVILTSISLSGVDARCVSLVSPQSYESGRYQQLCSTLPREEGSGKGMVVAVTSPSAGDGKTLTSINLAGACAHEFGARVLLVDAD